MVAVPCVCASFFRHQHSQRGQGGHAHFSSFTEGAGWVGGVGAVQRCLQSVHNFPLSVFILKWSTDYYATILTCFTVLLQCYVLNPLLVFDIFDIVCCGIRWETWTHKTEVFRCIMFICWLFVVDLLLVDKNICNATNQQVFVLETTNQIWICKEKKGDSTKFASMVKHKIINTTSR